MFSSDKNFPEALNLVPHADAFHHSQHHSGRFSRSRGASHGDDDPGGRRPEAPLVYRRAGVQALGALYLLWLGVKSFRKPAVDLMSLAAKSDKKETGASPASIFTRGILLQLTNPVLIIFFFSMFPQFIDQSGSFWGQSVLLSLLYALTLVVIHAGYAAAAAYARHLLTGKRGLLWVNRIGGFFFLAFGLFMLGKIIVRLISG